jgi:hypothetical protein
MDVEAKHYRTMKNAVWLYLYLLLNANRKTGFLMRKLETVSKDMGVTRDTALRWFNVLRRGGYIQTVNTGRSLTIQVTRWKALAGVGKSQLQKSESPGFRYGKHLTGPRAVSPGIPPRVGVIAGLAVTGNETKMKKTIRNDTGGGGDDKQVDQRFTGLGAGVRQELLAQELARGLNDSAGINLYRSYAAKYPEWLLRKVLTEVGALPPERITKGRGALFNYLVQHYGKGTTEHPGS